MKHIINKFSWILVFSTLLYACTEQEDVDFSKPLIGNVLIKDVITDMTLDQGEYKLYGRVIVREGATLTLNAGVIIKAAHQDTFKTWANKDNPKVPTIAYLLVEKGGKLIVNGTASQPVVFTSDSLKAGSWGGIIINGEAPIAQEEKTSVSGVFPYGGDKATDNSGSIKYLRIEYAGAKRSSRYDTGYPGSDNIDAFNLNGVGSETIVENVQVYKCSGKGVVINGGTVNLRKILVKGSVKTMYYWSYGWTGKGQFWTGQRNFEEVEGLADNTSFVGASSGVTEELPLYSNPTISNVTLIGNETGNNLIKFLSKAKGKMYNFVLADQTKTCVNVSGTSTVDLVNSGELVFGYTSVSNVGDNSYSKGIEEKFEEDENYIVEEVNFENGIVGSTLNGLDVSLQDSWFESTTYKGAVSADNDWTEGWTK